MGIGQLQSHCEGNKHQADTITRKDKWYLICQLQSDISNAGQDICAYWQHVSTTVDTAGEKKYEHLGYIAKAALTLSHGIAAPERGFSVNNALVTQEKNSVAERSIVALRVVKEVIRLFGSCTNVPMIKDLQ